MPSTTTSLNRARWTTLTRSTAMRSSPSSTTQSNQMRTCRSLLWRRFAACLKSQSKALMTSSKRERRWASGAKRLSNCPSSSPSRRMTITPFSWTRSRASTSARSLAGTISSDLSRSTSAKQRRTQISFRLALVSQAPRRTN